ncbi:hypothetical protein ILYODFUR_007312 [Ilyodon furcidens]|uniref:Uncharacterized protein n=1 Tax=Ilyodon furcidens TaxID=33524 RepID=A0ABV0TUD7_9TELE
MIAPPKAKQTERFSANKPPFTTTCQTQPLWVFSPPPGKRPSSNNKILHLSLNTRSCPDNNLPLFFSAQSDLPRISRRSSYLSINLLSQLSCVSLQLLQSHYGILHYFSDFLSV